MTVFRLNLATLPVVCDHGLHEPLILSRLRARCPTTIEVPTMIRCRALVLPKNLNHRGTETPRRRKKTHHRLGLFLLCASVPLWFISPNARAEDKKPAPVPDKVSYYKDVRPI